MKHKISPCIILLAVKIISGKQSTTELPLCPTNVQYFPQNLPMHCRMPNPPYDNQPFPIPPGMPVPFPLPGSIPESMPAPILAPVPAPMPLPESIPIPGLIPKPGSIPRPGPIFMPGPMPMPLPSVPMLPMAPPGPAHKLPVIVMPFYSPDPVYKRKSPHKRKRPPKRTFDLHTSTDTDTDTDTSMSSETDTDSSTSSDTSSDSGWWKSSKGHRRNARRLNRRHKLKKRKHAKKDLLTPILQFISKDGYVIFEKQISQGEAKQWLKGNSNTNKVKDVKNDNIKEQREYDDTSEHGVTVTYEEANIGKVKSDTYKVKDPRVTVTKNRQHKPRHLNNPMRLHR